MTERLLAWAAIGLIPIFLLAATVSLLVNPLIVREVSSGYDTAPRLMELAEQTVDYVERKAPAPAIYSGRELSHLADVQRVVSGAKLVAAISGILIAIGWLVARHRRRRHLIQRIAWRGGWLTIGVIVAFGLLAAVAWQKTFELFHRIFFAAGTYSFSSESLLIQLFPSRFWSSLAAIFGTLVLAEALLLLLLSRGFGTVRRRAKP